MDDILDFNEKHNKGVFNKWMIGVLVGMTIVGYVFMMLHLPFADILMLLGAPGLMAYVVTRVILTKAKGTRYISAVLLSTFIFIAVHVLIPGFEVFQFTVGVMVVMGIVQWVWFNLRKRGQA